MGAEAKQSARLGETCGGFDERTGESFPDCAEGLVCTRTAELSIPGAGSRCVHSKTSWCPKSSHQKCRMLCEEPSCPRGSCAMRQGPCCDYECEKAEEQETALIM